MAQPQAQDENKMQMAVFVRTKYLLFISPYLQFFFQTYTRRQY